MIKKADKMMTIEKSCCSQNQHGFNLLEILIALTIFSIGLLALAAMQVSAINGNALARTHTEASMLAVDRAERLLLLSYDDDDLKESGNPYEVVDGEYTITWNVTDTDLDSDGDDDIKNINVTVTWTYKTMEKRSVLNFVKNQEA